MSGFECGLLVFVQCVVDVGKVWRLFEGIWDWGGGCSVTSKVIVVGVVLRGCVGFHPRLCGMCGSRCCVIVWVGECIESDCSMMSSQKSLRGRRLCLLYILAR